MKLPTLDELVDQLKASAGVDDFDPDAPLPHSGVDSLDLVEWLYVIQDRYPEIGAHESLLENVDDTVSFRDVHARLVPASLTPAVGAPGDGA